jgi:hypothetical protein
VGPKPVEVCISLVLAYTDCCPSPSMDLKVNLPKGTGQTVKVAVIAQGNELLFLFLFHLYQSQINCRRDILNFA